MFSERIPHDVEGYEKALKSLESHLKKLPKPKDLALQKALHTFGERQTVSVRGGAKERKGSPFPSKAQQDPAGNTKCLEVGNWYGPNLCHFLLFDCK